MDIVSLLGSIFACIILLYVIYIIAKDIVITFMLESGKTRVGKVEAVPVEKGFCGIEDKHVHYRVVDKMKLSSSEGKAELTVIYYICPETGMVMISSVRKTLLKEAGKGGGT